MKPGTWKAMEEEQQQRTVTIFNRMKLQPH